LIKYLSKGYTETRKKRKEKKKKRRERERERRIGMGSRERKGMLNQEICETWQFVIFFERSLFFKFKIIVHVFIPNKIWIRIIFQKFI